MSTIPENTSTEIPSLWHPYHCKSLKKFPSTRLIHKLVHFVDSNITIQSSNGVVFKLHQVNLKVSMGAWNHSITGNEVVQLPETSTLLSLLFQFCYPEHHPELNHLPFSNLMELAKAVEKYKVFSVTHICRIRMKCILQCFLEHID
jgi:hypothetical protein